MPRHYRRAAALALVVALAACNDRKSADALDSALTAEANRAAAEDDPALTAALADQIMVDPALTAQSGAPGTRAVGALLQAPIPAAEPPAGAPPRPKGLLRTPPPSPVRARGELTLAELARMQAAKHGGQAAPPTCDQGFQYSHAWAARLPADLPLYPQAQVREAAGSDQPGCGIRVVSFVTRAPLPDVLDFYFTAATRAGFAPEHQAGGTEHILAGSRAAGAFYLMLVPRAGGGVEADLVSRSGG